MNCTFKHLTAKALSRTEADSLLILILITQLTSLEGSSNTTTSLHTLENPRVQYCSRPVAQARRRVVRRILEDALQLPKALTKGV